MLILFESSMHWAQLSPKSYLRALWLYT